LEQYVFQCIFNSLDICTVVSNFRTSVVFNSSEFIWTLIFSVTYTVTVSVRTTVTSFNRRSNTWSIRTVIIYVKDTVTVSVKNRTSVVFSWTSFFRTSILVVTDSITVSIRTSVAVWVV